MHDSVYLAERLLCGFNPDTSKHTTVLTYYRSFTFTMTSEKYS